jgi:hypothetical protein
MHPLEFARDRVHAIDRDRMRTGAILLEGSPFNKLLD